MYIVLNQNLGILEPGCVKIAEMEDGKHTIQYLNEQCMLERIDIENVDHEVIKYNISDVINDTENKNSEYFPLDEKYFIQVLWDLRVTNPRCEDYHEAIHNFTIKWGDYECSSCFEYEDGYGTIQFNQESFAAITVKSNFICIYLYNKEIAISAKKFIMSFLKDRDFKIYDIDTDITADLVHAF